MNPEKQNAKAERRADFNPFQFSNLNADPLKSVPY